MAVKTLKPAKSSAKAKTTAKPEVKKTVREKKALKPVASKVKAVLSVDDNLKKLAESTIPMTFVRKHEGAWDHALWLEFLEMIRKKGYEPIDADRVGLILEEAKAKYFAEKA